MLIPTAVRYSVNYKTECVYICVESYWSVWVSYQSNCITVFITVFFLMITSAIVIPKVIFCDAL